VASSVFRTLDHSATTREGGEKFEPAVPSTPFSQTRQAITQICAVLRSVIFLFFVFRRVRIVAKSAYYLHVRPYARMYQRVIQQTDFCEI
jgi:hypothetical protein